VRKQENFDDDNEGRPAIKRLRWMMELLESMDDEIGVNGVEVTAWMINGQNSNG